MRWAAKVDRTHREVVTTFRSCGANVLDLSRVGQGCPDLLVYRAGQWWLVEVKDAAGKLNIEQRAFINQGWPVRVIRSRDEAIQMMQGLA